MREGQLKSMLDVDIDTAIRLDGQRLEICDLIGGVL